MKPRSAQSFMCMGSLPNLATYPGEVAGTDSLTEFRAGLGYDSERGLELR